jgi:hypothetical protein
VTQVFGTHRRGCRRCRTASWWGRIKFSAVCHASSRCDSRTHAATRDQERKTNRRHMIGDHHGQTAGSATLLVRTMDGILRMHSGDGPPRAISRGLFFRGGQQPADAIGVGDDVMDGRDAGEPGVCRHECLCSSRVGRCGQDRVERAEARSLLEQA